MSKDPAHPSSEQPRPDIVEWRLTNTWTDRPAELVDYLTGVYLSLSLVGFAVAALAWAAATSGTDNAYPVSIGIGALAACILVWALLRLARRAHHSGREHQGARRPTR